MPIEGHLRAAVLGEDPGVGNGVLTKDALVFQAVYVAADFSFVSPLSEDFGVLADLSLGLRSSTQEMFEVQLNEAIRSVGFEEPALVFSRKSDRSYEFPSAQIAVDEFTFCGKRPFELHKVRIPHHLLVSGAD